MTKFPVLPLAPSRNILIALSSGQGIQPWLMGLTEVAYGSKPEKLSAKCGRDGHCWPPPAQIRACRIPAHGSHLGWV